MAKQGRLFIISGPSGVGKSTLIREVMNRYPNMRFSVSATTRDMRPGEIDGVSYYFVERDRFEKMIKNEELLEHAEYAGNYYGTPEEPVNESLNNGFDVLLDIEVQGALQVLKKRPDAVSVFVMAPSFDELERRLRGRGDTSEEKIIQRLETARKEVQLIPHYHYLLISETNEINKCTENMLSIIRAEKCKVEYSDYTELI